MVFVGLGEMVVYNKIIYNFKKQVIYDNALTHLLPINGVKEYIHICLHMHTHADIYAYCIVFSYIYYTHMNIYYPCMYLYLYFY